MSEGQYDTRKNTTFNPNSLKDALRQAHSVDQCSERCAQDLSDARHTIEQLIDYHNYQFRWLCALRRGLPQEMSPEAERGLYELAKAALDNTR